MLIKLQQDIGASAGKEPPKEFRIFSFGDNRSTRGTFLFDQQAAKDVLAAHKEHGAELALDYEHASLEDPAPPAGAPAAGWYDLELRDDGLWAVNVRWTPRATEYLKNAEYRYLSPAFTADPKTRRVKRLLNVALTNLPAMHDLDPLVAAKAVPYASGRVVNQAWDAAAAEGRLRKWASGGSSEKSDVDFDKYAKGFAYFDGSGEHFGDFHLPHHDVEGGTLVVSRRGVEAAAAAVQGARGASVPDTEVAAVKAHLAKHYREWGAKAPWEPQTHSGREANRGAKMETLLKMLGLQEDATEAEAVSALNARDTGRKELEGEVLALTGTKTLSEAKGQLAALKAKADERDTAVAEMEKLKAQALEREVTELVDGAVRDGKVPPALKAFWFEQGKRDVAMLKSFLEKAPVLIDTKPKTPSRNDAGGEVTLSDEDKVSAKQLGISEADFLKAKQEKAARQ